MKMRKTVVSFLVSGRGLNFSVVVRNIIHGKINASLGIVISDNKDAQVLDVANKLGMKSFFVDPVAYRDKKEHEKDMIKLLKNMKTDLIVAAGYMRILSPYFVNAYKNRIVNIHPSLLPSFPGASVQKKALDYGVKITGCTSHFIDEGIDTGPIIMQSVIPVLDTDTLNTLSARILREEFKILPESVKLFCEGKLKVIGRKVKVKK